MESEEEKLTKIQGIKNELIAIKSLLHKETLTWPYQKLDLDNFTRKFFPQLSSKEVKKYFKLTPEKFMGAIENKLKSISTVLHPLEDNIKALEFQKELFDFFSIFSPDNLVKCQNTLKKTPRGIREDFVSEEILELGKKNNFGQKRISEIMALWLNMRYYGAMSYGLCPKFLIPHLDSEKALNDKLKSISKAISKISPEIEKHSKEYDIWVVTKGQLDVQRKLMSFGPESIKSMIECLDLTYSLSLMGELSKSESLEVINSVQEIIIDAKNFESKEKKRIISEKDGKNIESLIAKIKEKPDLFFIIAKITHLLKEGKILNKEEKKNLEKIIKIIKLLPNNTKEALGNEELKKVFGIIFEPLENLLEIENIESEELKQKIVENESLKLLKGSIEQLSNWLLKRIVEEKKEGLANILEIFNGIPLILGNSIAKLIKNKKINVNIEKFKECIIEHLSKNGIYEIYSELSGEKVEKAVELEVASEIIIPPQADQRIAPILKQLKFEFMKFLEITTQNNQPLFDMFEINKIVPNNIVETLLNSSQDNLIKIISANAENKLNEIINVNKDEYEVKIKAISLKLEPLMKSFDDSLIEIIKSLEKNNEIRENSLISNFKEKIEKIWIDSLITKKKIEKVEKEISTSSVSAIAAQLEGKKPMEIKGPPKGPPSTLPPKDIPRAPPSGLPPKEVPRAPPSAIPSKEVPRAPPSAIPSKEVPRAPPSALPPKKVPKTTPSVLYPKEVLKSPPEKPLQVPSKPSEPIPIKSLTIQEIPSKISKDLPETMLETLQKFPSLKPTTSLMSDKNQIEIEEEDRKKLESIKKTISEVETILDTYITEPDKYSPNEIKSAFKLLAKVHKLNIENVTPKEVREVITFAEELKITRDIINSQMQHLKQLNIDKRLNEASLKLLESKIELIVKYFDEYINKIESFIEYLGEKTSFYLKEYEKKAGEAYWNRLKLIKYRVELKENVHFLVKIAQLSDKLIKEAMSYYYKLQESRKLKKKKLIGENATELANLIGIEKKKVLELTRENELRLSIEEIFKIRSRTNKIKKT